MKRAWMKTFFTTSYHRYLNELRLGKTALGSGLYGVPCSCKHKQRGSVLCLRSLGNGSSCEEDEYLDLIRGSLSPHRHGCRVSYGHGCSICTRCVMNKQPVFGLLETR